MSKISRTPTPEETHSADPGQNNPTAPAQTDPPAAEEAKQADAPTPQKVDPPAGRPRARRRAASQSLWQEFISWVSEMRAEQPVKLGLLAAVTVVALVLLVAIPVAMLTSGPAVPVEPSDEPEPEATATVRPEPPEDAEYDASAGVIDTEVFQGTVLPESDDAGAEYVADTLFLGDSNTCRYMLYGEDDKIPFTSTNNNIGVVSMGAGAITSLKCEQFKGMSGSYTMPEAVKMLKPRRIIIGFGTNNLSGTSTNADAFIKTYRAGLKAIHDAYPYADLIVNSIPPIDKQRENTNLHQSQIDAYNAAIVQMCEEEGYKYLNSAETLKDPNTGWAKTDYTLSDGVHLSKQAVTALFKYIRTHAYITEDTRPKPLGDIPTPDGVIPDLIKSDPIAVRGAKYPIEVGVDGEGKASAGASSAKAGTSVKLSATPDEGWEFDYWSASAGSISGNTLTMPAVCDANGVYVVAHFKKTGCTEHDYYEVTDVEAGPGTEGKGHYVCRNCGKSGESYTIPAKPAATKTPATATPTPTPTPTPSTAPTPTPPTHEHNFQRVVVTEPTCTSDGTAVYRCECKQENGSETIPALGHDFSVSVVDSEATESAPGSGHYVCSRCQATGDSYTIPQLPVQQPTVEETPVEQSLTDGTENA